MNFPVEDLEPVEPEGNEIANYLGPAFIDMRLGSGFGRALGKIEDRVLNLDLGFDGAVQKGAPFYGKVYRPGGEKGDRDLAIRLVQPDTFDRIGPPDEGYVDIFDVPGIAFYLRQLPVDITEQDIRQGDAEGE